MAKNCKFGYDNGFGNQNLNGAKGCVNVGSHLSEPRGSAISESYVGGGQKDAPGQFYGHAQLAAGTDTSGC